MTNTREDILLASAVIFLIAFSGLIFNAIGIAIVLKSPIFRNAFGSLCLSHSIANIGVLFVFFIWAAPTTYIQPSSTNNIVNKILGQLNILCWDACVYSHLAISFNRISSIALPAKMNIIFSRRNTYFLISTVWMLALIHILPYFVYSECYVKYNPLTWTWDFADTECGFIISTYTDYYTSVTTFCIMTIIDFSTLILLVIYRKKSSFSSSDESAKRRRAEIRFFMQSCAQGALFFYEIFNFYYVSTLHNSQWYIFFTSTVAWEICHCLDGLVVVVFHLRTCLFSNNSKRMLIRTSAPTRTITMNL